MYRNDLCQLFSTQQGTPVWLAIAGGVSFSYFVCLYLVGYFKTFYGKYGTLRFVGGLLAQIVLIPVFSLMEATAVFYGILSPPKGFYIGPKRDELIEDIPQINSSQKRAVAELVEAQAVVAEH